MTTYDVVLSAMFAAIIAALGAMPGIPIPLLPVPITLQFLGVMLAGALLGPWRGAASVAILVALVAMGMPLLAGGRGGMAVLAGPTAGFVFGWIAAAFVIGLLARGFARPRPRWQALAGTFLACAVGGIVVDYAFGLAWLAFVSKIDPSKAAYGMLAFIPGDLVKAAVAASLTVAIRRVHPIEPK